MQLIVQPYGAVIDVRTNNDLLSLLREASIPISYSCEDGRCGLCRYELVSGKVFENSGMPWRTSGLEPSYRLACQSMLESDSIIRVADPENIVVHEPQRRMRARIIDSWNLSERVVAIKIRCDKVMRFSPGQFARVDFGGVGKRTYSFTSAESKRDLVFHCMIHPFGGVSNKVLANQPVGRRVIVEGPLGFSYLRYNDDCPIICVASESGVGPMLSILDGMRRNNMTNDIYLYIGFMRGEDVYGVQDIEELSSELQIKERQILVYSPKSGEGDGAITGRVRQNHKNLSLYRAYVYGTSYASRGVARLLIRLGVKRERLHVDSFV